MTLRALSALWLAAACRSRPAAEDAWADLGWLDALAAAPAPFIDTLQAHEQGWVALHEHRYTQAHAGLPAAAASRAAWDEALLQHDLSGLHAAVIDKLMVAWAQNHLDPDVALPGIQAWSARCHGGQAPGLAHPSTPALEHVLLRREAVHAAARAGQPEALLEVIEAPLMLDVDARGFTHTWYDPCAHEALADGWIKRGGPMDPTASPDDSASALLFAPWATAVDLAAAATQCPDPWSMPGCLPSTDALGLTRFDPERATPDEARASMRALTSRLDAFRDALPGRPGEDIITELGLLQRQRQRWLVDRARALLAASRPDLAMALLEPAVDVTARGVGPTNAPSLFALLAHARFAAGRSREALDALQPLADLRPDVRGTREVLADLVTLEGIHRIGDSKEH